MVSSNASPPQVLLVEDDAEQRALLGELIEGWGLDVDDVGTVQAAIAALASRSYAAVVTDFSLPDGFATELISKGHVDPARVIMVSGHGEAEIGLAVAFFRKPIDIAEFRARLLAVAATSGRSARAARASGVFAAQQLAEPARTFHFVLYVAGNSQTSLGARTNLASALVKLDRTGLTVDIVDLASASAEILEEDRVTFTPTLVRRSPSPRAWLIGDMTDVALVKRFLHNAGMRASADG